MDFGSKIMRAILSNSSATETLRHRDHICAIKTRMSESLARTIQIRKGSEKLVWILLLCFLFSISFSIAISHTLLGLLTIVYLYWKFRHDPKFPRIPILVPVLAFVYCSLLSLIFSLHPSISFPGTKNLTLFIIIPIFYDAVHDLEDVHVIYGVLILAAVISACYGLVQFFGSDAGLVQTRIRGFMGHWMTFSGELMILNVLLLSHLLFSANHPRWFYPAFGILSLALLLSLTRNAWLGFLAATFTLIAMRRFRWIFAIPAVVLIIFVGSVLVFPSFVADRISGIFNPNETSNRDRLQMLESGWKIIQDYPITGVGTDMIKQVYPRYRPPDSPFQEHAHLHNNLIQLAAENGILTLAAWLWLLVQVLLDLIRWKRHVMSPDERFLIHGTIGVVISVFVAGMFEYNFGDSEIKMLFLALITIPYAWFKTREQARNLQLAGAEKELLPAGATS
jgi:O-antigen ligase